MEKVMLDSNASTFFGDNEEARQLLRQVQERNLIKLFTSPIQEGEIAKIPSNKQAIKDRTNNVQVSCDKVESPLDPSNLSGTSYLGEGNILKEGQDRNDACIVSRAISERMDILITDDRDIIRKASNSIRCMKSTEFVEHIKCLLSR